METAFSLEGIISIFLDATGILIAIWILHSEIKQLMKRLIEQKNGCLSREQAKDFSEMYIDRIKAELHRKVDQVKLDLKDKPAGTNIYNKVLDHAMEVRLSMYHTRGQTTAFYLCNDISFKQFIENTHIQFAENINNGHLLFKNILKEYFEEKISLAQLSTMAHEEIENVSTIVKDIIKVEITKLYKRG